MKSSSFLVTAEGGEWSPAESTTPDCKGERKEVNTHLPEKHHCPHHDMRELLGAVDRPTQETVPSDWIAAQKECTFSLHAPASETARKQRERLAVQRALSVPQRSSLRCYWNMLCSSASLHLLPLADSRYQMEISHHSSPKTAPTLSRQQTFMAYCLRHLCPLTTAACKSACICKVTKLPYLEVLAFLWLF